MESQTRNITVHREEVLTLDEHDPNTITILASGPLTSPALARRRPPGDSPAPTTSPSTTPSPPSSTPPPSTWTRSTSPPATTRAPPTTSTAPSPSEEYDTFLEALTTAEDRPPQILGKPPHRRPLRPKFVISTKSEDLLATELDCNHLRQHPSKVGFDTAKPPFKLQYFEGCLPIEETARRGRDTLRFGP